MLRCWATPPFLAPAPKTKTDIFSGWACRFQTFHPKVLTFCLQYSSPACLSCGLSPCLTAIN